jgi:hypothetical protein
MTQGSSGGRGVNLSEQPMRGIRGRCPGCYSNLGGILIGPTQRELEDESTYLGQPEHAADQFALDNRGPGPASSWAMFSQVNRFPARIVLVSVRSIASDSGAPRRDRIGRLNQSFCTQRRITTASARRRRRQTTVQGLLPRQYHENLQC